MRRYLPYFLFFALTALTSRAQTVRWESADSGDPSDIQLVFENCEPDGDPQLPNLTGVVFTLTGTSTQTNIINFSATHSTILTYRIRSQKTGPIQIPAINVVTDKGTVRVAAYTGASAAVPLDSVTNSTLAPAGNTFWAGEVFPLSYTIGIARRYYSQIGPNVDWSPPPLIAEDWSKPEPFQTSATSDARVGYVYRARAYAKTAGRISLNSVQQLVNLQTGSVGFGLFQQPRLEQVTVTSNRPDLTIRPLPAGAPSSFSGAVGQFTLQSKVVPTTAAVGEPVTWTLTLGGNGNWPDIAGLPAREVSKDFQVVQPEAKRTPAEGKLFDATLAEDVVLVPTKPGSYTLGPVTYAYFDPKTNAYQTITTAKTTITITAPPPKIIPASGPDLSPSGGETVATTAALTAKAPPPPGVIPRDPLTGKGSAFVPLTVVTLLYVGAIPFVILGGIWGSLAMRRARVTDPFLARRQARARVLENLHELRSNSDRTTRARLLVDWQHDVTSLWQLSHAAPAAAMFADPEWAGLWNDSERALYHADGNLPDDWITRAETALKAKPVPNFSAFQLFRPRNLVPFLVLALAFSVASTQLKADAISDYRSGKFAEAEQALRATVKQDPTDWIARHNLALALSQQDRWGEAEAQMTAAFVQNPSDASVRWHLTALSEKAGFVPEPLALFVRPEPIQYLARLASPSTWQFLAVLGCVFVAFALSFALWGAYRGISTVGRFLAGLAAISGLILIAAAALGIRAYGNSADRRAVIAWHASTLWSIPTEADTAQKTTALPAGSVAIVDRTFLGWSHLVFTNQQTGWVKKEDVIGLWK